MEERKLNMKKRDIIVFDTETTGLSSDIHEVIQISAVHIDPVRLEITDTFDSMMAPLTPETATQAALDTHGFTLAELAEAPHPKVVWKDFVAFVERYNKEGNIFTAPIAVGHNVKFDLSFVNKYCLQYGPWSKTKNQQLLFYYNSLDTYQMAYSWFEHDNSIDNCRLQTLMDYYGVSSEAAHNALYDTRFTAEIFIRFLKLHRKLRDEYNVKFRNCMKGWE